MRFRVLAAAGAIAVVSAITFGILLEALLDQQRIAGPGRAASDARYAIAEVQRLTLETQLGEAEARAQLPGAVDRLAAVPNDTPQRRRIGLLTAAVGGQRWNAVRTLLAELDASERAELMQIRTQTREARDRAIATASVGFAVLLILVGIVSFGAVRVVVRPVARLQAFARELGARRYGARLPESGPPETIELAQAFNATAVSLAAAEAELREVGERHLAQLDAVFSAAPLGLAFVDRELTVDGRVYLASFFPVHDVVGAAVIDITERRRAEVARERLQHITAELGAAVTVPDVARVAVEEARAVFETDGAAVLLVEGEALELAQSRGLTDAAAQRLAVLPLSSPHPAAVVVRTRRPVYVSDPEDLAARYPALSGLVPALGALPLVASGATIGVLLVDFTQPRVLESDERDLLEAIAGQTAVALERAQLYEREHAVAQTLQASLLPRALPTIPGLDLAARLQAGATGIQVGGDFYDAFAIGDGAWGLAIGDVCGKGVDAAALTALSRHTMRAAAVEGHSPADVLRALNRAVLADARLGQFLTAIFARLDGTTLTVACGGHPPPVLLGADGAMKPLESAGTLLGVLDDPNVTDTVVSLEAGDTLLLYTDGLTEAGAPRSTLDTGDVAALLADARSDTAAGTVERVLARALDLGGGVIRDDVAVLVAQPSTAGRTPAGESSTRGQ